MPIPIGISLAAPLERVHTFYLKGQPGLDMISVGVEVRAAHPRSFEAELTTVQLGAIAVDSLSATPYTTRRTQRQIDLLDLDTVYFGLLRIGSTLISQDRRQCMLTRGASSIMCSSRTMRSEHFAGPGGGSRGTSSAAHAARGARNHSILTTVPMAMLPGKSAKVAGLTATVLPKTALLLAATNFLSTVSLGLPQPGSAAANFVEHAIVDLLLAVIAERTSESLPAEATEAGTRLRIRDFVLRRLPDLELGPQRIAAEFGISTRYLHRLFESEDTSVASFIRHERLKKAAGDLADPALRHLDVRTIASRSGFAGADQFTRAFKLKYGISPRDFRRGGLDYVGLPRNIVSIAEAVPDEQFDG